MQQWADQIVLNRYAPVGVVINDDLEILQFRGETSPYLRPPLGEPSFNLLKMIRPSLLVDVRAAIEEVKKQNVSIKRESLPFEDRRVGDVTLEVIPFNVSMAQERCFLVLFERTSAETVVSENNRPLSPLEEEVTLDADTNQFLQELANARQELLDTQTFLRLTIEEQESTNQQLIAANEEILSSNEELKSTNEELQTAKEEIQAANEELRTTNEELQSRNAESRRANDDLINLIDNVNIPILMLSNDLCIRRFTPMMSSIFNLIPSDIGRPITDIRFEIEVPDLEALIFQGIETLNTIERDVQDRDGHWYLLRIRPYRTVENQIDGAVVMLVDIDNLKRVEQNLRDSQAQLEAELFAMNQVQALSLELFASHDFNQALHKVLESAMAVHRTTMGILHLYNPESDMLEMVVQHGFGQDVLGYFQEVRRQDGSPLSRAFSQQEQVLIGDVQLDLVVEPYRSIALGVGFRAMQSTPLISRNGELLGMLSTYFAEPHSLTERERRLLDLYSRQASEFIDLTRSIREQQALLEREQAAQAANASKDEFLSVLSHELRTPLTGILGWIQLIELGMLDGAALIDAIASIRTSAQIQLKLMEDLLDASRIVQERFQINRQPMDLTEMLRRVITLVQPQALEKGLQLETALESGVDMLALDPVRMEQVFSNLLSNAVKFTPSGGCITVQLTDSPSQVQVQISDTGQGITPEALRYIFERFRQVDASNTRREGGLGLGLFLVRSIVEAHGGTVVAESPGEGQGSKFTLTLPKAEAAEPIRSTAFPTRPAIDVSLEGVRILLVEDNKVTLQIFKAFLEAEGAVVFTAQSAPEALEIIAREPLDILISDIGLPEVNGYEFIRQVRSRLPEQGGQLPAIAVTGYVTEQDAETAIEAGFQLHLRKPVKFESLALAVFSLLQR
ncbi:MAG: ATP-binding protein [Cyanobacteria bacterium J06638_22]